MAFAKTLSHKALDVESLAQNTLKLHRICTTPASGTQILKLSSVHTSAAPTHSTARHRSVPPREPRLAGAALSPSDVPTPRVSAASLLRLPDCAAGAPVIEHGREMLEAEPRGDG